MAHQQMLQNSFSIDRILSPEFGKCVTNASTNNERRDETGNSKMEKLSGCRSSEIECKETNRKRTKFTAEQLVQLAASFTRSNYVTLAEMEILIKNLGVSRRCVKTWFQNQRTKLKKERQSTEREMPMFTSGEDSNIHGFSNLDRPMPRLGQGELYTCYNRTICTYGQQSCYSWQQATHNSCGMTFDKPTAGFNRGIQAGPERAHYQQTDHHSCFLQPCQPPPLSVMTPAGQAYHQTNMADAMRWEERPSVSRLSHFPMKRKLENTSCDYTKKHRIDSSMPNTLPTRQQWLANDTQQKGSCKLNSIVV